MNLEEAKAHMLAHGEGWSFYIKKMDSMSRDTMSSEQKALMRAGWLVNTPQAYAMAALGADLAKKVSGGTEGAAGEDHGGHLASVSPDSDEDLEGEDDYETHCAMEGRMGRFV